MKKRFLLSLLVFLVPYIHSQGEWYWQNPLPQGNNLFNVRFVNSNTAYAAGGAGTILKTTDSGANWESETPPTTSTLLGLNFSPENIGWAVGTDGVVITTLNPVPVELTSFTAEALKNNIRLNWQTATETNNKGFEIERSQKSNIKNQKEWEKIGFVRGHGTTTEENNYTYTDKNLEAGNYLYRLVQIDFDGTPNESEAVNVEISSQPLQYVLMQNYPNPFNPVTTISYSIPQDGNVQIKVFNSIGEEVSSLVNGFKNSGSYKVNFDASDLPSGIYYYRIKAGSFTSVRKMIVLK